MADFVRFATAAETVSGFSRGAVADAMHQRQLKAQLHNLEVDPVAPRIIRWFEDADGAPEVDKIEGTATEIMVLLTPTMDKPSNWSKTSNRRPITIKKLMGI